MSEERPIDHVFLPRHAPPEGETTIVEITPQLLELLQEQLEAFRQLAASGTTVPIVVTCDAQGVPDSQRLTAEGLKNAQATTAVINYYSMNLRAGLTFRNYSRGAILTHAVLEAESAMPTEDVAEANGVLVWLADEERVVVVRFPNSGDLTGERVLGLPVYSAAQPLAQFPPPREGLGAVTACGFLEGEAGTWAMYERGDLVQRNREGKVILEAPQPVIEGEVRAVRAERDGRIVVDLMGREVELFKAPAPLYAAAVTQSAQFALSAHDGQTVLWDLYVGHAPQVIPIEGHHTALAFSHGGNLGLLGGADGSLTVMRFLPD
jgi:hypothetical protein